MPLSPASQLPLPWLYNAIAAAAAAAAAVLAEVAPGSASYDKLELHPRDVQDSLTFIVQYKKLFIVYTIIPLSPTQTA